MQIVQTVVGRLAIAFGFLLFTMSVLNSQGHHSFDLDAPAARSSFWTIEDVGSANRIEADLEIRELRRDTQWRPAFHLALGTSDRTMAVRIVQEQRARDATISVIVTERGKMTGQQVIDGWTLAKGQRFQLVMDWSTPGTLAISSDGTDRGKFELDFVPTSLQISVSTGEMFGHKVSLITK